jgi:uncharacterized membrane protein YjdF
MEPAERPPPSSVLHKRVTIGLQAVIAAGLVLEAYEGQWLNMAVVTGILLLTMLPAVLARHVRVVVPHEFELLTIGFIFAALFLGETRDYYGRFWWWDIALHTTSGGLLGVLGVLLIYVLNETPRIDLHMRPGFVAFFAFCFAVTVGAVWEIFEFAMDRLFGLNMQKPMLGDPSGLTDTMWDLIVDCLGALVISVTGYVYRKRGVESMMGRWIRQFIASNPRLFSRK